MGEMDLDRRERSGFVLRERRSAGFVARVAQSSDESTSENDSMMLQIAKGADQRSRRYRGSAAPALR